MDAMTAVLIVAVLAGVGRSPVLADGGVLDAMHPDLDAFQVKYLRYAEAGGAVDDCVFRRGDGATLSVSSANYPSAAERRTRVTNGIAGSLQRRPATSSEEEAAMHRTLTGKPLGDLIHRFESPGHEAIRFSAGEETAEVGVTFQYKATGAPGHYIWQIGNYDSDRILVEDVVRRLLGRMLAWEHFHEVRDGLVTSSQSQVTDSAGTVYVSVADWTSTHGISFQRQRKVGISFAYHGKSVQVLTGSERIKIGDEWRTLNGCAMEVDNRIFVPRQGFVSALP